MKQDIIHTTVILLAALALEGCGKGEVENVEKPSSATLSPGKPVVRPKAPPLRPADESVDLEVKVPANDSGFADAAKYLDAGGDMYVYMRTEELMRQFEQRLSEFSGFMKKMNDIDRRRGRWVGSDQELAEILPRIIRAGLMDLGLQGFRGVGASSFVKEKGLYQNRVFLLRDPAAQKPIRIEEILGGAAHEQAGIKFMPANTALGFHGDFNLAALFGLVKETVLASGNIELISEFMRGVGVRDPRVIMPYVFAGPLNEKERQYIGRWAGSNKNDPNEKWETLMLPDHTYIDASVSMEEGKKVTSRGGGYWKVEGDQFTILSSTQDGDPVPLEELSATVFKLATFKKDRVVGVTQDDMPFQQLIGGRSHYDTLDEVMGGGMEDGGPPMPFDGIEEAKKINQVVESPDPGLKEPEPATKGGPEPEKTGAEVVEDPPLPPYMQREVATLKRAAVKGEMRAQVRLGEMLFDVGRRIEGYKWLAIAANNGERGAQEMIQFYGRNLSPAQLAKAKQQAEEFKPEEPFTFIDRRVQAFTMPAMKKFNGPDVLKPGQTVKAPSTMADQIASQFGNQLGLAITLDDAQPIAIKAGGEQFILPTPGTVIWLKLNVGEEGKLFDTLMENLEVILSSAPVEIKLSAEEIGGVKAHTLSMPPLPTKVPLSPTILRFEDFVILTSTRDLAREVIAVYQGKEKGLAGTPEFQRLSKGLDLEGNQIQFVSSRAALHAPAVKKAMEVLMKRALGRDADKPEGEMFRGILNQTLSSGQPSSHLAVVRVQPDGLLFDGRATDDGYRAAVQQSAIIPLAVSSAVILSHEEKEPEVGYASAPVAQLRELALAIKLYAEDHDGQLPPQDKWCDAILGEVGSKKSFVKPAAKPDVASSYAINSALKGWKTSDLGPSTVLVFESGGSWNHNGGLAEAQAAARGNGRVLIGFGDGNVRTIPADALARLNWKEKQKAGEKVRPAPPFPTADRIGSGPPFSPKSSDNKYSKETTIK